LGFKNDTNTEEYVAYLTQIAFIHKGIAKIDKSDWDEENPKPYYSYDYDYEGYLPDYFTIVDFLFAEYKLKRNKNIKKLNHIFQYVSATDLSNYTYCPIGYSISKTYETPKNKLTEIGTKKHEEHRLFKAIISNQNRSNKTDSEESNNSLTDFITKENKFLELGT